MKNLAKTALLAVLFTSLLASVPTARADAGAKPVDLRSFVEALWPEAQARGIERTTFDTALAGIVSDPSVAAMTHAQPEDLKPLGAYLAAQVTPGRVAAGKAMLALWSDDLAAIEKRYGVPKAIIVAVWGLESNFGASVGTKDVVRSLATLAAMNYRPELYRAELLSALTMLQAGDATRESLKGSWAGAMGQPQFLPSSFEKYAVDGDGDGRRDIWTDVPDALASIANFLRQQGWEPGRPWGFGVDLPRGFDMQESRAPYEHWGAAGVTRQDGTSMPEAGTGILLLPAGATGPAFLVSENYEVLKTYNFSDAYVLSVGELADRVEGGTRVRTAWPTIPPASRAVRVAIQALLVGLGYTVDNRQGRISLALRDVIRAAQTRVGQIPDGNPTLALLTALQNVR